MAKLSEEVKAFIVQRLACYDSPSQVAAAVKEAFGLTVDRRQVDGYDATRAGPKPAKKWCAKFHAIREQFKEQIEEIPITNAAVRLRRLDRMATKLEDRSNFLGAAALLKQAAEEVGGIYTNRRELTGKDGSPLHPAPALDDMTDEELFAFAQRLMQHAGDTDEASP